MAFDLDRALGRKDYASYWLKIARVLAERNRWKVDHLPTVLEIVMSTLGEAWLLEEARRPERTPITGDARKHPVGMMLAIPSLDNVVSMIELAVYFRRCGDLPRFGLLRPNLRSVTQFKGTRTQLACTHTVRRH